MRQKISLFLFVMMLFQFPAIACPEVKPAEERSEEESNPVEPNEMEPNVAHGSIPLVSVAQWQSSLRSNPNQLPLVFAQNNQRPLIFHQRSRKSPIPRSLVGFGMIFGGLYLLATVSENSGKGRIAAAIILIGGGNAVNISAP